MKVLGLSIDASYEIVGFRKMTKIKRLHSRTVDVRHGALFTTQWNEAGFEMDGADSKKKFSMVFEQKMRKAKLVFFSFEVDTNVNSKRLGSFCVAPTAFAKTF